MTGEDRDLARILESTPRPEGCLSSWTLQRYAMDELGGSERDDVAIHVASCPHCREEIQGLDRGREAFLEDRPFAEVEAELAERAMFVPDDPEVRVIRPLWPRLRVAVAALAAGAAALVLTLLMLPSPPDADPNRVKGITDLSAGLLRDGEVSQIEEGTVLRPGDEIQFRVDMGEHDHLVVVGLDGTGTVSVYQPRDGGSSLPVEPGAGRTIDGAFRLDAAPGPEVYVAFFTDEPIESRLAAQVVERWAADGGVATVLERAEAGALGGAVEVLALDKEVAPR